MYIEKGKYYLCIKTVTMSGSGDEAYLKGKVYYSEYEHCLTDEDREPKHYVSGWDIPRFAAEHFIEVNAVMAAYGKCMMDMAKNK